MSKINLVVVNQFGDYKKGDIISDQALIDEILNPENEKFFISSHVRKITVPNNLESEVFEDSVPEQIQELPTVDISSVAEEENTHPAEVLEILGDEK